MKKTVSYSAAAMLLAAAASTAFGQSPTIDGTKDAAYGAALYLNTANPTGFGDNVPGFFPCSDFGSGISLAIDNSNIAGVSGGACSGGSLGADAVVTGVELKIPFAAIANPTEGSFRLGGFVNGSGHDFLSNQVIGLTACNGNFGEPRGLDLGVAAPGNQFVTIVNGADTAASGPTIDGQLDAGFYGTALWVNTFETGFGDSNVGTPTSANGSEIDAVYARVVTVGAEKAIYIFISGNLETNFNKLDLFLDTVAGAGQNQIRGDNNPNIDFNAINRMGDNPVGAGNGLKFDAGFDPDYFFTCTNGNNPTAIFANFAELPSGGNGAGRFLGTTNAPGPLNITPCVPTPNGVPSPDKAYGSEIDGVYSVLCGSGADQYLYVFIAGNLEVNGNRLNLFIDADSATTNAGQNTLRADNVAIDFNGLNRMGAGNNGAGLTFDAGFNADYWIAFRNNDGSPVDVFSWASHLRTSGAAGDVVGAQGLLDYGSFNGGPKTSNNPITFDGQFCVRVNALNMNACEPNGFGSTWNPTSLPGIDVQGDINQVANNLAVVPEIYSSFAPRLISQNVFDPLGRVSPNPNLTVPGLIQMTIDNNNVAGVTGDASTGADLVTTGYELRIRVDELGWDGISPIRIAGFINSGGQDFVSNQVIGGLPSGTANLGEPQAINFDLIAGNQFVTAGSCSAAVTGACCEGTTCTVRAQTACPGGAGTNQSFAGVNTVCNTFPAATSPCCLADFNHVGGITVQDIFDFLNAYFGNASTANINGGALSVQDIFDFLNAYFAGGC